MGRLKTVPPRIKPAAQRQLGTTVVSERRMTGRKLQARRLAIWVRDPHCARCGKLVGYPEGFELDHVIPLHLGGEDMEHNCQVLCVKVKVVDGQRVKTGCHATKTEEDAAA